MVINWILPRANMSGGVKSNRLLAEAMARRGHDVAIAFRSNPRPGPRIWQLRSLARHFRDRFATAGHTPHHLEGSSVALIPVARNRIGPADVRDADIVIATWWETREWIESWPAEKGIKAYFVRGHELHGGDPDRVRSTYRMAGPKFVISTWLQRLMATEYGDEGAVLVPNGVDRGQFDSSPRGRQPVPTVGLMYGRQEYKGPRTAFDCLRRLRDRFPDLRAIAFGSSPIRSEHAAPPWLEYHLRPEPPQIADIYRQVDCWIVPSTTEGFGMPGLEAAACRCPVVSTRCGGPEDYIDEGRSGYLVPVGDADAMADAAGRVLGLDDNRWRRMSQASYDISTRYDWDRSAVILEQALLNATGETRMGSRRSKTQRPLAGGGAR